MEQEIIELDARIAQLIDAFELARRNNRELSSRQASLEAENQMLKNKLATAIIRIEKLLTTLPVEES